MKPSATSRIKLVLISVILAAALFWGVRCFTDRPAVESPPSGGSRAAVIADWGTFSRFCEASTIIAWEGGFLVGDNETEDRLFRFTAAMEPQGEIRLGQEVEDIESLAVVSGQVLVVGSQSANKRGRRRPDRERVLLLGGSAISPDLTNCPPCEAARPLPPKRGGLSIEGAAIWAGALWLGLRSPLVQDEAILLRLEGDPASELSVAEMITIDFDGFGVREMLPLASGELLILAGPADAADTPHRLYRLERPGAEPTSLEIELPTSTEGLAPAGDGQWITVTDGDGNPGETCRVEATWRRIRLPLER